MRRALVVLALVACKDDKKPAAQPPPPVVVDAAPVGFDACRVSKAALDTATCEQAELQTQLMTAKKSIDGIIDALGQIGAGNPQQFQVACAELLVAIERDATKAKCVLGMDPAQRAQIVELLEKWYAQRVQVTPTGDAASDAFIAKLAAVRDATCACTDAACLDRVDKQLAAVGQPPGNLVAAARDVGGKLLEDSQRCAKRVRTLTDPKQ